MKYPKTKIDKWGWRFARNPWEPDLRDTRPIKKRGLNSSTGVCAVCGDYAKWSFHFVPSTALHRMIEPKSDHVAVCDNLKCARALENIGFCGCGCGG